eukprot:3665164-Pleurochrysis_carterae.AAC.1
MASAADVGAASSNELSFPFSCAAPSTPLPSQGRRVAFATSAGVNSFEQIAHKLAPDASHAVCVVLSSSFAQNR